jgi:hypothetical protein
VPRQSVSGSAVITAWLTQASGGAKSGLVASVTDLKNKRLNCKKKNCGIAVIRR